MTDKKILGPPTGETKEVPRHDTMWFADWVTCPNDATHKIVESRLRYYCRDCGVWWEK